MRPFPHRSVLNSLLSAAFAAALLLQPGCRSSGGLDAETLVDTGTSSTLTLPSPALEPATAPAEAPAAPAVDHYPRVTIAKKLALAAPSAPAETGTNNADPSPSGPAETPGGLAPANSDPSAEPGKVTGPLTNMLPDVYRLKPLDQVVTTMRFPVQQTTEDVVDEKGNITLPLLGDVKAAGFTTSELEAELTRLYVEGGFYKTTILMVLVPSLNYTISGEVYRPGRYEIRGTVTLVQAIAEGGNFTEYANKKKIQIIRGTQFIEKNYFDILADPRQDIEILPRDSIRVPRGW